MKFNRSRATVALLVGGIAATGVHAQSAVAKALPAETIAFFSFPNIAKSIEDMQAAPIAKMWHEGEVQDFVADALQMLESRWDEGLAEGQRAFENGDFPFDPNRLTKLRLDSLSFALTDLGIGEFEGEPFPEIGVLVHAHLGDSAAIWRDAISVFLDKAVEESRGKASLTKSKIGAADVMTLGPADMPDFPLSLNIAFIGDQMVAGTRHGEMATFLQNLGGETSHLASSPNYLSSARHLNSDGVAAEAYFRPIALFDFAIEALKIAKQEERELRNVDVDGIHRVISALGLRSILSIGGTSTYQNGRCVSKSFVACPEQTRSGLLGGVTGNVDMARLRWIPKDAASMSMTQLDISTIYPTLVRALHAYDPDFAADILGKLAEKEAEVGISLEKDIFGAFGSRYVSWQLPMASFASAPEMATIIEVKNQDGLVKALKRVADLSEGFLEIEENERRGIKVYQIVINLDDLGGGGFNPLAAFTPTFAFKDGNLVLAFSTGDIKRAFKRMDREDDPTGDIRSNSEFAPYLQKLPQSGVQSVMFRDWKAEFESLYQIGTTVLAFVPLDNEIPVDLSLLPDSSTLTQHLFGSCSWTRVTNEGFMTTDIGPWGPETVALLMGCIGAGAATAAYFEGQF